MKGLLGAVAISTAIACAGSAWAQGAGLPASPAASGNHATPPAAYSGPSPRGEHHMQSHRAAAHGHARTHRGSAVRPAEASTADNLNRQELGTLQGSAAAMPLPAPAPTGGRSLGPKASGGTYIPPTR